MKRIFDGPAKGVGAGYSWEGNKQVGKGRMTVTQSTPPTAISYRLEFIEPFASIAAANFTLKPEGDQAVTATWSMNGNNTFVGKVISVFTNMDKMIGAEFEKGLASLESISEAEAKKQAARQWTFLCSMEETDHDLCTVDRSGPARGPLSVRRWNEAGPAGRGADEADAPAGPVRAVHRRGRGARRDRPDPPRAPAHSPGPDTARRRRAGDYHDRCDGAHTGGR